MKRQDDERDDDGEAIMLRDEGVIGEEKMERKKGKERRKSQVKEKR